VIDPRDLSVTPFWLDDRRREQQRLGPLRADAAKRGLRGHIQTIWLDCGYDSHALRKNLVERTVNDAITARKKKRGSSLPRQNQPM
jgi:hypothetical protein